MGHYDKGEITLEEVIALWPHDSMTNGELLRELLRALIGLYKRIRILEGGG